MGATEVTRESVILEIENRAWQNVYVYSANYAMTRPKAGREQEWKQAVDTAHMVDALVAELRGKAGAP